MATKTPADSKKSNPFADNPGKGGKAPLFKPGAKAGKTAGGKKPGKMPSAGKIGKG